MLALTNDLVWCYGTMCNAAFANLVVTGLRNMTPKSARRMYLKHMKCHPACTEHKQMIRQLGMIAKKLELDSRFPAIQQGTYKVGSGKRHGGKGRGMGWRAYLQGRG